MLNWCISKTGEKKKIEQKFTSSSLNFRSNPVLGSANRLRNNFPRQAFQISITVPSGSLDLCAIRTGKIVTITGAILRTTQSGSRCCSSWTGTPASLQYQQCAFCLLNHSENTIEHNVNILPFVI